MKKKNVCIFVLILLLFSFYTNVLAGETKCEYDNGHLVITFDGKGGAPQVSSDFYDEAMKKVEDGILKETSYGVNNFTDKFVQANGFDVLEGLCPEKISYCTYMESGMNSIVRGATSFDWGISTSGISFYASSARLSQDLASKGRYEGFGIYTSASDELSESLASNDKWYEKGWVIIKTPFKEIKDLIWNSDKTETSLGAFYYDCYKDKQYSGKLDTYNLNCPGTMGYLSSLSKSIIEYNKAKDSNDAVTIANSITDINETSETLRKYCYNILSNYNMKADEEDCINQCLNIGKTISSMKEALGIDNGTPQCGLSGRIIIWISNVVRWAKYLVPVAVIVLGIIDFIKAIASNKEDEMKKAQKKFIIRLISAALIFIVPFIIEFVLNKMGFDANGCGIIDL